jgi:hypothetical protein
MSLSIAADTPRFIPVLFQGDAAAMKRALDEMLSLPIKHAVAAHVDIEGLCGARVKALLEATWGWTSLSPEELDAVRDALKRSFT